MTLLPRDRVDELILGGSGCGFNMTLLPGDMVCTVEKVLTGFGGIGTPLTMMAGPAWTWVEDPTTALRTADAVMAMVVMRIM